MKPLAMTLGISTRISEQERGAGARRASSGSCGAG